MAATVQPQTKAEVLIALVNETTPSDIEEIDRRIRNHESEIAKLIEIRKLIDVRLNGPRKRGGGPRKKLPQATSDDDDDRPPMPRVKAEASEIRTGRRKAVATLLGSEGPMIRNVIANRLGIPGAALPSVIACDWFTEGSQGVALTSIGRREAGL